MENSEFEAIPYYSLRSKILKKEQDRLKCEKNINGVCDEIKEQFRENIFGAAKAM